VGGKRIKNRSKRRVMSSSNTVKPLKRAIMICFAVLLFTAVGVIISTVELDFGTENSLTNDSVKKTYCEYIDFGVVKNEIIDGYIDEVRPEGYSENIMDGLAVLLEKDKLDAEKEYSVIVDMGNFEREFYKSWKDKGNLDENELLQRYIEERKLLTEKLKNVEITQEEYNEKSEGLAVRYHSDMLKLEQEKTDWMHLKRVKILVSFSGEELADGYYLIKAEREEIKELASGGYILRFLGNGLKELVEKTEGNIDNALAWMMKNSGKEALSVKLSLKVGEGTEAIGKLEAGKRISDFLSGIMLLDKYNNDVGFSVSYRIDGDLKYTTVDCELTLSKQEVLELLRSGASRIYLSFVCRDEDVKEYAEYFYSVYGDGVYKNIKEITK